MMTHYCSLQVALPFNSVLGAVFHIAPRAVKLFVQGLSRPLLVGQRSDDKPRILPFGQTFGLADYTPFARPAVAGHIVRTAVAIDQLAPNNGPASGSTLQCAVYAYRHVV